MRVKFWGVRGSIPSPPTNEEFCARLVETLHRLGQDDRWIDLSDRGAIADWVRALPPSLNSFVGANTPCVEVRAGDELLIIDFGSGVRELGASLMAREFGAGQGHAHLFLSHFHYDHIQGWPFFRPVYVAGNRFDLYSRFPNTLETLQLHQQAPFFPPASIDGMRAEIAVHELEESSTLIANGQIRVSTLELEHPSRCFAFRIEANGKTLVYASDGAYPMPSAEKDDRASEAISFFEGADLIIFDAQFSLAESMEKRDWGHSSAVVGVELAARAGAKSLALFHHDPASSDGYLEHLLRVGREYSLHPPAPCKAGAVEVFLAREGMEVEL